MDPSHEIEVLFRAKYPMSMSSRGRAASGKDPCRRLQDPEPHDAFVDGNARHGAAVPRPSGSPAPQGVLPGELDALAQAHEAPEYTVFLLKDFMPI